MEGGFELNNHGDLWADTFDSEDMSAATTVYHSSKVTIDYRAEQPRDTPDAPFHTDDASAATIDYADEGCPSGAGTPAMILPDEGGDDRLDLCRCDSVDSSDLTVWAGNLSSERKMRTGRRRRRRRRWLLLLMALVFLLAILIGLGAGIGATGGRKGGGSSDAVATSLGSVNVRECLEELEEEEEQIIETYEPAASQRVSEDELREPYETGVMQGESNEAADTAETSESPGGAGKAGKAEQESRSRRDGAGRGRKRDLRGSRKRRKLECEELLGAKGSTSSKSKSKSTSKSSKTTVKSGSDADKVEDPTDDEASASEAIEKDADEAITDGPGNELTDKPTDIPTEKPTPTAAGKVYDVLANVVPDEVPSSVDHADSDAALVSATDDPADNPTSKPTSEPTKVPTPKTTHGPTNEPTNVPTAGPTGKPTSEPSRKRTDPPLGILPDIALGASAEPPVRYGYSNSTTRCTGGKVIERQNINGPPPLADKSNVALQFFAFGSTPYDSHSNTCIGEDGRREDVCARWNCAAGTSLPADNACTFEGPEYACVRDEIMPYMNGRMEAGDASFIVHTGDFIRGGGEASNTRCTHFSFASRRDLFSAGANFLPVPGDNDWNECYGYDKSSNTDPVRELWRGNFATEASPFHQFDTDFAGGGRPAIHRQDGNPENYFFEYNNVAVFGINRPGGRSYVSDWAPEDPNEAWVADRLGRDRCLYKSIVIVSHSPPKDSLYAMVEEHFAACGTSPAVLTISGNAQPRSYCMTMDSAKNRVKVTVEAFQSGPLLVSVVRNPDGGGDFFHAEDVDATDSNRRCPNLL